VLSPEIENRDEVEVATGRRTKRPFSLNDIQSVYKVWDKIHVGKIARAARFYFEKCHPVTCNLFK
jgi:hypothetical protein